MQYEIEQNRDRDREPRTDVTPHSDEDSSGSSDNEQAEVGVGGAMNDGVREDERDEEEHGEMIELVHTRHLIQVPSEKYQLGGALESPARDPDEHDVEQFPDKQAGAPISASNQSRFNVYQRQLDSDNEYAPFLSKGDWEIAKWTKTYLSPDSITEFLHLGVSTKQFIISES